MRRGVVIALLAGWLLGIGTASLDQVWYEYLMLRASDCAAWKRGTYDPGPFRIVPNQPNDCYLRAPRVTLLWSN